MAAPRRARRLAALLLVTLVALGATANGARNSSTTAVSTSVMTASRSSSTRTLSPVASDDSGSDTTSDDGNDSSESRTSDDRSANGEGSSEAGVFSSSADVDGSDDSGSSSLTDEPGVVHAASYSDSNSDSGSDASSTSSTLTPAPSPPPSQTTSSASASSATTAWSEFSSSAADWTMTPVTVVHARVQADEPEWDDEHQTFVSMYGDSFTEKFRAALDTANTASVEGALMYVQAEGINAQEQSVECERKNGMAYVVFYALQLTQTKNSVALYQSSAPAIEYCPFVAMDSGRCTPTDGDSVFPKECYQYYGLQGETDIGLCVGGESKDTDFRAPYPETYWFSLPNSCPLEERAGKTDTCRKKYHGGLCAHGSAPDGENCTFSYRILGYISIDDLVGITSLQDNTTGEFYANYSQFCEAGGVEFSAVVDEDAKTVEVEESLEFWADPTNSTANAQRAQLMVDRYAELVAADTDGRMVALPSVDELTASNPPCYLNNVQCADAEYGCRRVGYFQVCEVCSNANEGDESCIVAPEGFTFPDLEVVEGSSSSSGLEIEGESESGSTSNTGGTPTSDGDEGSDALESSGSDTDMNSIKSTSNDATTTTKTAIATCTWLVVASTSTAMMAVVL